MYLNQADIANVLESDIYSKCTWIRLIQQMYLNQADIANVLESGWYSKYTWIRLI